MMNMHKCVTYKPCTDCIIISCKLGLWQVQGPYDLETDNKAEKEYKKYRDLGKYKNLPKEKKDVRSIGIKKSR